MEPGGGLGGENPGDGGREGMSKPAEGGEEEDRNVGRNFDVVDQVEPLGRFQDAPQRSCGQNNRQRGGQQPEAELCFMEEGRRNLKDAVH